jgi:hypothetical protein
MRKQIEIELAWFRFFCDICEGGGGALWFAVLRVKVIIFIRCCCAVWHLLVGIGRRGPTLAVIIAFTDYLGSHNRSCLGPKQDLNKTYLDFGSQDRSFDPCMP